MHVGLHLGVDELEALRRERRAGGGDGPQLLEPVGPARRQPTLGGGLDEPCRGAEERDALGVGEVEQPHRVGCAVVQHQRGLARQSRHQPVPHHPARGREVESPVARAHVAMQAVLHQVLQQDAAGAVDDGLGHARGSRGVQHVERVIEGQGRELQARRAGGGRGLVQEDLPGHGPGQAAEVGIGAQERHDDDPLGATEVGDDLPQAPEAVELLAPVAVAVGGHQNPRADLPEAVEHAVGAEVG